MLKTNHCPLCGSKDIEILKKHLFKFPGEDIQNHLLDAPYVRLWILFERILKNRNDAVITSLLCKNCGLIFTNPRLSYDEVKIKYDTINELGSVKYRLQQDPLFKLDRRAKRIYKLIDQFFHLDPQQAKPKVLDYGGASGYNLIPFIDNFECSILDYEKWELPKGITYLGKDISELNETERFDIILLLHTLEHALEPKVFLGELCKFLKNQGIIYVEVPLGCFKEWAYKSDPLTHFNFFSEESLYNCLKYCGLNVIHLSTSYQWVMHGKMWCLNILGSKQYHKEPGIVKPILSTKEQMNKAGYYLPYLLNRRIIRKIFRKSRGKALKNPFSSLGRRSG